MADEGLPLTRGLQQYGLIENFSRQAFFTVAWLWAMTRFNFESTISFLTTNIFLECKWIIVDFK